MSSQCMNKPGAEVICEGSDGELVGRLIRYRTISILGRARGDWRRPVLRCKPNREVGRVEVPVIE